MSILNFVNEYFDRENGLLHYQKHILDNHEYDITYDEYNSMADTLARTPVDNIHIFGHVERNKINNKVRYVKYDNRNELLTTFIFNSVGTPINITAYRATYKEYLEMEKGHGNYIFLNTIMKGL